MVEQKQIIVQKEDAVFWMDENGVWHNEHGRFEHPKVIKYFNASIKKDDRGYYVHQVTDEFEEKVYFPYKETAVFVMGVKIGENVQLVLNTRTAVNLDAGKLFSRDDSLYLDTPDHLIKFSSQSLIKLAKYMKDKSGQMVLDINERIYTVLNMDG